MASAVRAMTPDPVAKRTGWTTVAVTRGLIGLGAGLIGLFRPEWAAIALGAALVAVSLLELAVRVTTGDPSADSRRRQRRLLRVGAGVLAGLALMGSMMGGAETEMRVLAFALGILGLVDAWGAWHATTPGFAACG